MQAAILRVAVLAVHMLMLAVVANFPRTAQATAGDFDVAGAALPMDAAPEVDVTDVPLVERTERREPAVAPLVLGTVAIGITLGAFGVTSRFRHKP